jgi:hypothetical protein
MHFYRVVLLAVVGLLIGTTGSSHGACPRSSRSNAWWKRSTSSATAACAKASFITFKRGRVILTVSIGQRRPANNSFAELFDKVGTRVTQKMRRAACARYFEVKELPIIHDIHLKAEGVRIRRAQTFRERRVGVSKKRSSIR